jgi:hypothetical protein
VLAHSFTPNPSAHLEVNWIAVKISPGQSPFNIEISGSIKLFHLEQVIEHIQRVH